MVNVVLAKTSAATAIDVDGAGATGIVSSGGDLDDSLVTSVVANSAGVLTGAQPVESAAALGVPLGELATAYFDAGRTEQGQSLVDGGSFLADDDPGPSLAGLSTSCCRA